MQKPLHFLRGVVATVFAMTLVACDDKGPDLQWQTITLKDAGLTTVFPVPCDIQAAHTMVDFGMGDGAVQVSMIGCDSPITASTYAVSQWLLDDPSRADDALAFWQADVLSKLKAVDSKKEKSGASFVPQGAMQLSRSIRATVEGERATGWTVTTHGVWFARKEGNKARIFHAVIFAPKPQHEIADIFFRGLKLQELAAPASQ